MYRQERAGRTEQRHCQNRKATARFSAEQDSQIMTSFEAEQNAEEERGWDTNQKKGNGPRRQIHPIRSEKQSEMVLHRSHSLPFATECTLPYFGKRGRGVGGVVGSETNFGAGFECCGEHIPFPRENRSIVTRTGLGGSSGSRGPSEAKGSAADGGCAVGREERQEVLVGAQSGVGFSSITDSLSLVAHVGESIREEEASESSDAADETCVSVGGRACRSGVVESDLARVFGDGVFRSKLVAGLRSGSADDFERCPADPCRRRAFHQFQNRRVPQELYRHILNINLRHVQSEWSVASASAGQRVGDTRKKRALIDPAGSVPLVGSLVCGRFVNKLDFGFTTHGASELGSFTFGAVRTLGAD
ncbi:hypothetical protein BLNAU_23266 [Blattamonas nauphoetae]|uniref:Uncharacterized protein n=1 Tax=Blattamonas nauphoetae TaxID=2049346 RepID=A0ABQ9WQN5_9EUKA|nr:hypothetical protein BLNAU_23266 [Blattamonas nauphoetae]